MQKIRNQFALSPQFRPMLAKGKPKVMSDDEYWALIEKHLPVLGTPKMDGIRCVVREKPIIDLLEQFNVEAQTRYLKAIPNRYIQRTIAKADLTGLDGEILTFGEDGKVDKFHVTDSKVMSEDGEPDFEYHVFDLIEPVPYWDRMAWLKDQIVFPENTPFKKCLPVYLPTIKDVMSYDEACVQAGFEGTMLRTVNGPYKFGRATLKQGYLIKLKRFTDTEGEVVGFVELQHNLNPAALNKLGLTERSDHIANKIAGAKLGALIVKSPQWNETFNIGTGFTMQERFDIWNNQSLYMGRTVKFKFQPHGEKDKPRSPVYLGWRSVQDYQPELENEE